MQMHLSIIHGPIKNLTISSTPEIRVDDAECTLLKFPVRNNGHLSTLRLIAKYNKRSGGECQRVIFQTLLNLHFSRLASPILMVTTPLNAKPPTPLYFYPFMSNHTKKNKE